MMMNTEELEPVFITAVGTNVYLAEDLLEFCRGESDLMQLFEDDAPKTFAALLMELTDCSRAAAEQMWEELSWEL